MNDRSPQSNYGGLCHLLDETQVALVSIHHVYYDAVLYLFAAEHPLALESFEHELDVIDLWLVVAVASIHVDGKAFD